MAVKNPSQRLHENRNMPRIEILDDPKTLAKWGEPKKMLLAPPIEYDELMKKIPHGKVITADLLRDHLAEKHGADFACQLTGGMFINIAAHANEERAALDETPNGDETPCGDNTHCVAETPWWRTLKKDGELNEKFPGGIDNHKFKLEIEGHEVIQKGKRYFVKNFDQKLFDLSE